MGNALHVILAILLTLVLVSLVQATAMSAPIVLHVLHATLDSQMFLGVVNAYKEAT